MKISTWNVNGIRSALKSGFIEFLDQEKPDIVLLQEVRMPVDLLTDKMIPGFKFHLNPGEKKGYSGVGILVADSFREGKLKTEFDIPYSNSEGRVISINYSQIEIVCVYAPHSHRSLKNIEKKREFIKGLRKYCENVTRNGRKLLIGGDLNVAMDDRDVENNKQNFGNACFNDIEISGIQEILDLGFLDVFRIFEKNKGFYTWWSLIGENRQNNVGWRLDYFLANRSLAESFTECKHNTFYKASDHCPVTLSIKRDKFFS